MPLPTQPQESARSMQDRAAKMQTAGARDATFLASESCGRLTR